MAEAETKTSFKNLNEALKYLEKRADNIKRYSDKLREAIKEIDAFFEDIIKETGVYYHYPTPIQEWDPEEWPSDLYLAFGKVHTYRPSNATRPIHGYGLYLCYHEDIGTFYDWVINVSRKKLMQVVKILPDAIQKYTEKVEKTEKRVKELSKLAEKIAELIPKKDTKKGE